MTTATAPAPADWLRPEDGGRAISAAAVLEVLRGQERMIATLLCWLHRYQRPAEPEDFGLSMAGESTMHRLLVRALLPPGRVVSREALLAAAYAGQLAAGYSHTDVLACLRTELSRLRVAVAERHRDGVRWSIPRASTTREYVLLAPGMPLPTGYGPIRGPRGTRRTLAPARCLDAWRRLAAGQTHARIRAETGVSEQAIGELRRGRHWTQREGLVAGWQVGLTRGEAAPRGHGVNPVGVARSG